MASRDQPMTTRPNWDPCIAVRLGNSLILVMPLTSQQLGLRDGQMIGREMFGQILAGHVSEVRCELAAERGGVN